MYRLARTVQIPFFVLMATLLLGTRFFSPAAQVQAEEFKPFATVALNSVDNHFGRCQFHWWFSR